MTKGTTSYRIKDEQALYFLTWSTVNWIDVFTDRRCRDIVVDSLKYCQREKGLELYCWCLMSNHIHLIAKAKDGYLLSHIIRDLKKHCTKQIIKTIMQEPESRKSWLLREMFLAGQNNSKKQYYQLWRNDNHPIELTHPATMDQKTDYIHLNPVVNGLVERPEHYVYSSAKNYCGGEGLLDVEFL